MTVAETLFAQEEGVSRALGGWELALAAGVIVVVTILTLIALFVFFRRIQESTLLERTIQQWIDELRPMPDSVAAVVDEVATRRYEFLTFYGQFILTALVVALITLLLVAGAVTPSAGLPILATILGIVFGKAVLSRRALPERPPETEPALPRPRATTRPAGEGAVRPEAGGEAALEEEAIEEELEEALEEEPESFALEEEEQPPAEEPGEGEVGPEEPEGPPRGGGRG